MQVIQSIQITRDSILHWFPSRHIIQSLFRGGITFLFFLLHVTAFAQHNNSFFAASEDSLILAGREVYEAKDDVSAQAANTIFFQLFQRTLATTGSEEYPFDSLRFVSKVASTGHEFRIFTWVVPRRDFSSFHYYGFVQGYDKKKKKTFLFPLTDHSPMIQKRETARLSNDNWYGATYYKLITKRYKRKNYYTLLGWKGNDTKTTEKVIEVISYNGKKVMFGNNPAFRLRNKSRNRIVFIYNAKAVMSLRFEDTAGVIVCDHLSVPDASLIGQWEYYGPDFSYDAFKFKKGKWILIEDFDARNPSEYDRGKPRERKPEPPVYKSR